MSDVVLKSILDRRSLLRSVTQKTKVKLPQHVKELVLTPGKRDGEDVYEVAGEWELLPEKKCVILMVARGRFWTRLHGAEVDPEHHTVEIMQPSDSKLTRRAISQLFTRKIAQSASAPIETIQRCTEPTPTRFLSQEALKFLLDPFGARQLRSTIPV